MKLFTVISDEKFQNRTVVKMVTKAKNEFEAIQEARRYYAVNFRQSAKWFAKEGHLETELIGYGETVLKNELN